MLVTCMVAHRCHGSWLTLLVVLYGACGTLGVRIINCNNNKVEIFEDSPAPVTCGDITSTAGVFWRRGDGVTIGECSADGTCTTDLYSDYSLRRSPQSTESQLTLVPDYRRHAGLTVTCQDRDRPSTATCTFVIRHHSELSGCQVTNNTVDWTVSGSCRVQQAFSSDNIYTCTWTRNTGETFGGFEASRELCSFTQALPQAGGLYTYSISVSPPATTTFSRELRLVEPAGEVTTSCPHSVVSGRALSCTCQTTNTASPPATVRWEGGDSEKLVKTNVQREDNGTQFTCHVTWAGRVYTSINYTLLVEYVEGPSDVVISETDHPGSNGSNVVTLSCNTTGVVYPGANFTWSTVVCQNETHTARSSTCTVCLDAEDDGKSVTCTAINSIDSRISVSTSVTLRINGAGNVSVVSTSVSRSSASAVVGPVVGAIVAMIVTAVIAILLVILIRRRRRKLKKAHKKITKSQQLKDSEFEEHINVVYESSETAGPKSSCGHNYRSRGQGTDSEASHWNKQVVSAQYEDSPSQGYYSEIREIVTGKTYPQPHLRLTMNLYSN